MAEPEWDAETRNLVLGFAAVSMCPHCGRPTAVCQDPEHEFDWEALPPARCHAKTAVLRHQQGFTEQSNPQLGALLWGAVLKAEGAGGG